MVNELSITKSSATHPHSEDINIYWSDEEVCLCFNEMIQGPNSPLPSNVYSDVNPFQYLPQNLPDGIWYLILTELKKVEENGFWKAKGDACLIFENATIFGWRTTFEFYEGNPPNAQKTNWVMQEYRLTNKIQDDSREKNPSILCRIFQSYEGSLGGTSSEELFVSGQGSTSKPQVNNGANETKPLPETDAYHPKENNVEDVQMGEDIFATGNFLELSDLDNPIPMSPSSSSENSSCLSMTSDLDFESLTGDIESKDKRVQHDKNENLKYNILSSRRSQEIVISPAPVGSFTCHERNMSTVQSLKIDPSPPLLHTEKNVSGEGSSSNPTDKTASSSYGAAVTSDGKVAAGSKKGKFKKYLCFIPH